MGVFADRFPQLEQAIYVNFGCKTELRRFADDPKGVFEFLKDRVSLSLTEQKERLFDLVDEVSSTMVEHGCPPKKHFEDWDLDGLATLFRELDEVVCESFGDRSRPFQRWLEAAHTKPVAKERLLSP